MNDTQTNHLDTFQRNRPLLFSIAYRMLGSAADSEDILQEAYLRFQTVNLSEIESPRSYLATIVTRLCLNQLASARVQREVYPGPWLPEPILSVDHPEISDPETHAGEYDSISLAFLALLERLTPAERAVFILRGVFDFEYREIADMLGKSEAACRKLFSRARSFISTHRPRFEASPEQHRRLLESFMLAAGSGDLDGLVGLLAEDVIFWADGGGKVRGAALQPIYGRIAVASFVIGVTSRFTPSGAGFLVTDVNGKPTLLIRHADGKAAYVVSIAVGEKGISNIWVIANPDKLGAI